MWKWIKIPKAVALLAFLLPWMTVSCQNTTIATASGFGLAFGQVSAMGQAAGNSDGGSINLWLILAIIAIAGGLFLSIRKGREAAKFVLGTSVAALVLIFIGTMSYSKQAIIDAAADNGQPIDQAALALIEVDMQIGYWIALLALVVSAAFAWLVMMGKDDEAEAKLRGLAADAAEAAKGAAAKASEAASTAAAVASDAAAKAGDVASDVAAKASDVAGGAAETLKSTASEVADKVSDAASEAAERVESLIKKDEPPKE